MCFVSFCGDVVDVTAIAGAVGEDKIKTNGADIDHAMVHGKCSKRGEHVWDTQWSGELQTRCMLQVEKRECCRLRGTRMRHEGSCAA